MMPHQSSARQRKKSPDGIGRERARGTGDRLVRGVLLAVTLGVASVSCSRPSSNLVESNLIEAPRVWNDRDLAEWANPVAGLNVRPDHFSEAEYYAGPVADWVRTYPVYFPGREPAGYWDQLQSKKPEPLIAAGPRTEEDWIEAGKRVFEELDVPVFRSTDARLIATVRSKEEFEKMGGHPQPDGTVHFLRWVPTSKGLALGINDCASCHTRQLPDGTRLNGAQVDAAGDGVVGALISSGDQSFFGNEPAAVIAWRGFTVPWISGDIHDQIRSMSDAQLAELGASNPPGTFARFNGSPFYPPRYRIWRDQGSEVHRPHGDARVARSGGCRAVRHSGGLLR